jgi:hypothetical protein
LFCLSLFPASGETREIVFDSSKELSETRIPLVEMGAGTPNDWSGYEALVLELRTSSPQRVRLRVFTGKEPEKFSQVVLQLYPGAWVRAAIPVSTLTAAPTTGYDMASVGNRSRPGYYLGLWGPFVPLTAVTAIGLSWRNLLVHHSWKYVHCRWSKNPRATKCSGHYRW